MRMRQRSCAGALLPALASSNEEQAFSKSGQTHPPCLWPGCHMPIHGLPAGRARGMAQLQPNQYLIHIRSLTLIWDAEQQLATGGIQATDDAVGTP